MGLNLWVLNLGNSGTDKVKANNHSVASAWVFPKASPIVFDCEWLHAERLMVA